LDIRTVRAGQHKDRLPGLRIAAERGGALFLLAQQPLDLGGVEIGWRQIVRQGDPDGVAVVFLLEIGAIAAHSHARIDVVQHQGMNITRIDLLLFGLDLLIQAIIAQEERLEIGPSLGMALGDIVQRLLHLGGELHIDQIGEMALHQVIHCKRHESRRELVAGPGGIAAILDRADDRGVGAGAADPLAFQRLDERGIGVARRGLGVVLDRLQLDTIDPFAGLELREDRLLVVQGGGRIVGGFDVRAEEAGE